MPHRQWRPSPHTLPFPPDDPIYGATPPAGGSSIFLRNGALRGKRGLLTVSADSLMRLGHNPFFPYLEQRVTAFLSRELVRGDAGAQG